MFSQKSTLWARLCAAAVVGLIFVTSLVAFAGTANAAPNGPVAPGIIAQATATPLPPTPRPPAAPENDRRTIDGDQIVSGNNFTLRANEILRGDLTVFGGNAVLEEGSRVAGSVSVFGGEADVYGLVDGNINVVGGSLKLRASATVDGSVRMLGGLVDRDPAAHVRGQTSRITPVPPNRITARPNSPFNIVVDLISAAFAKMVGLILITLLAIALVTLFPTYTAITAGVVRHQWLVAGSIGLLTFIAMPVAIVLMAITICLIPAAIIIALAWTVAILFGWVVAARVAGEVIATQLRLTSWNILGQTIMGVVVLALLGMIPFIGWIFGFLASSVGLGALVLTRGGTRGYPVMPAPPPSLPTPAPTA